MAPTTFQFLLAFSFLVPMLLSQVQSKSTIQHLVGSQKGRSTKGLHLVKQYLAKYGYLNYDLAGLKDEKIHEYDDEFDESLELALKNFQQNYHLEVTGTLDNRTVNQMMMPRCGRPDFVKDRRLGHQSSRSFNGFVADYAFLYGIPRWSKTHLTYTFRSSIQVPGTENIRTILDRAFQRWAQVTHFTFQEVFGNSDSDIVIGFRSGEHGDGVPFDGPGGVFAHAFSPPIGVFHYDADENWSNNPGPGEVDLESVAVHEIGHLLGLAHSRDHPEAVMYPYIDYMQGKRELQEDDIEGIQTLYGL